MSVIGNWWCCRTRMTRSHIWSGKLFVCDLWKQALWRNWWRALQQMMENWSQHISMCSLLHIALLPLLSKSWPCFWTGEWQIFCFLKSDVLMVEKSYNCGIKLTYFKVYCLSIQDCHVAWNFEHAVLQEEWPLIVLRITFVIFCICMIYSVDTTYWTI